MQGFKSGEDDWPLSPFPLACSCSLQSLSSPIQEQEQDLSGSTYRVLHVYQKRSHIYPEFKWIMSFMIYCSKQLGWLLHITQRPFASTVGIGIPMGYSTVYYALHPIGLAEMALD